MNVRVFLSSTRGDLDADCRPSVLTAVTYAKVELVEMDSWDSAHENPILVCRCKIREESSHFLGLFAHYRGWAPEALLGKSITQAEYEWALEFLGKSRMAVFMPIAGTELDHRLRERARTQSHVDDEAQKIFLMKVRREICLPFKDTYELVCKVYQRVTFWKGGGLVAMATPGNTPRLSSRPRPSEDDIYSLGRRRHQTQFEETLQMLSGRSGPRIAGFLIHGPKGHGHQALANRLAQIFERTGAPVQRRVIMKVDSPWQGNHSAALFACLAGRLEIETRADVVSSIGRELEAVLQGGDFLLEIRQAQKFEGGLANLLTSFWQPLTAAIKRPGPGRLVGLITLEEEKAVPDGPLQPAPLPDCDPDSFDPAVIIRLPRLDPFAPGEIALWTPRWFGADHQAVAQYLFRETRGHPAELFTLLRDDDALWTS